MPVDQIKEVVSVRRKYTFSAEQHHCMGKFLLGSTVWEKALPWLMVSVGSVVMVGLTHNCLWEVMRELGILWMRGIRHGAQER